MKPKTKKPLSPAKAMTREIAALNKEEQKIVVCATREEIKQERAAVRGIAALETQLAVLRRGWKKWATAHEAATQRRLGQLDRRRNILEARLAAL